MSITQKEIREVNHEYRRCKRNLALCKRMDKKRASLNHAKLSKMTRKANKERRKSYHQHQKIERKKQRDKIRLYRGKVIWCKRHATSIDECTLSNELLQEIGRPLPLKIVIMIFNIFAVILFPISVLIVSIKDEFLKEYADTNQPFDILDENTSEK